MTVKQFKAFINTIPDCEQEDEFIIEVDEMWYTPESIRRAYSVGKNLLILEIKESDIV